MFYVLEKTVHRLLRKWLTVYFHKGVNWKNGYQDWKFQLSIDANSNQKSVFEEVPFRMVVFFQINIFFIKERHTIRSIISFYRFHICSGNTILFVRDCIQDLIYLGGNLPLKLYSKSRLVRANKTLKESVQTRLKS